MISKNYYNHFIQILNEELIPAMGCTEPIAIAYAAALGKETLGDLPEKVVLYVSRNIIKNVKSVIVPHTHGMRGIEAAAAVGVIAGNSKAILEVISEVTEDQIEETKAFMTSVPFIVNASESDAIFDIHIYMTKGTHSSEIRIKDAHTNVVWIKKDDQLIFEKKDCGMESQTRGDKSLLTIKNIFEFADIVQIEDIASVIERQISYNMSIAREGLRGDYGANIGKLILKMNDPSDVKIRAKAYAAAGSDARMNGCEMPVVINSGSGNQGMTASLPVIVYAKELGVSKEKLYRALVVSNLATIHIKEGIGRLSAYCGAVGAGCGCAAGIAYLYDKDYIIGGRALENGLAIVSGMICDGAKASCAAKIAFSVEAGIMGCAMAFDDQNFHGGDGILKEDVEDTIKSVGQLARIGMSETDKEIIRIMIE